MMCKSKDEKKQTKFSLKKLFKRIIDENNRLKKEKHSLECQINQLEERERDIEKQIGQLELQKSLLEQEINEKQNTVKKVKLINGVKNFINYAVEIVCLVLFAYATSNFKNKGTSEGAIEKGILGLVLALILVMVDVIIDDYLLSHKMIKCEKPIKLVFSEYWELIKVFAQTLLTSICLAIAIYYTYDNKVLIEYLKNNRMDFLIVAVVFLLAMALATFVVSYIVLKIKALLHKSSTKCKKKIEKTSKE